MLLVAGLALLLTTISLYVTEADAATYVVPDDYDTIQDALDDAADGDTVHVRAGTYTEPLMIHRAVTLVGDGPGRTIVKEVTSTNLVVNSDRANISLMTFNGGDGARGVYFSGRDNCTFSDVEFVGHEYGGIYMTWARDNTLLNVTFRDCGYALMMRERCWNNTFRDCAFNDSGTGAWIEPFEYEYTCSHSNLFEGCTFANNTIGAHLGHAGDDNRFLSCRFEWNEEGVRLERGASTTIEGCDFESNLAIAVNITGSEVDGTVVDGCAFTMNTNASIYLGETDHVTMRDLDLVGNEYGVRVVGSHNITVSDSNMERNGFDIYMTDDSHGINVTRVKLRRTIRSASLIFEGCRGVRLTEVDVLDSSNNGCYMGRGCSAFTISGCEFSQTGGYGLTVTSTEQLTIDDSTFLDNHDFGVMFSLVDTGSMTDCTVEVNGVGSLRLEGVSRFLFANLTLRMNGNNGLLFENSGMCTFRDVAVSSEGQGILMRQSSWVVLERVECTDCTTKGLLAYSCSNTTLEGCSFTRCSVGASLQQGTSDTYVGNCSFELNINTGLHALDAASLEVRGCNLDRNTHASGLWVQGASLDILVDGCTCNWNGYCGMAFDTRSAPGVSGVVVMDSEVIGNNYGISMDLVYDALITRCNCSRNVRGSVIVRTNSSTFSDSHFSGNSYAGLLFYMCDGCEVSNATAADNDRFGIFLSDSGGPRGNRVHNSSLLGNGLVNNSGGVCLVDFASNNVIEHNDFEGNMVGVVIERRQSGAVGNVIRRNTIKGSGQCGLVESGPCKPVLINLNAFFGNPEHVMGPDQNERFDDGELGNYWDDYKERYPGARVTGPVWDTPYEVQEESGVLDHYPLAYPYEENPPVVTMSGDRTVSQGVETLLDIGKCADDSAIARKTWTVIRGGWVMAELSHHEYTFWQLGEHTVRLTVFDVWGNLATAEVVYTVIDATPPRADAGADLSVGILEEFTLDASASTDNIAIAHFTWDLWDDEGSVRKETGQYVTLALSEVGAYVAYLTVRDAAGHTDTDEVRVQVLDSVAPVADAGPDVTVDQGEIVDFDGTGSSDNLAVTDWEWSIDLEGSTRRLKGSRPTFVFEHAGTYEVTLTVMDARGNADTDEVLVHVRDVTPPVADAGAERLLVSQGTTVRLDAGNSTDNVGIATYTWSVDLGEGAVTMDGAEVSLLVNELGEHLVTLNVSDASGNWAEDHLTLVVLDATRPLVELGPDRTAEAGVSVRLAPVSASDNVGIASYVWTITWEGGDRTLEGREVEFTFPREGDYTVTLTVGDGQLNRASDSMTVHVGPESWHTSDASYAWVLALLVSTVALAVALFLRLRDGSSG